MTAGLSLVLILAATLRFTVWLLLTKCPDDTAAPRGGAL